MSSKKEAGRISTRSSSIELLRILAMLMIVMYHLACHTDWVALDGHFFNYYLVTFLSGFGKIGVGIFFITSGYFLCMLKKFNWRRLLKILRPMWFYSLTFLIIFMATKSPLIEWGFPLSSNVAQSLFPLLTNGYWFIGAYVGINLLFPFIKQWLDATSDRDCVKCTLLIGLICLIPQWFSILLTSTNSTLFVFPSAFFYTLIGYTIKRNEEKIKSLAWPTVALLVGLAAICICPIALRYAHIFGYNDNLLALFRETESLPCILVSASLFIIFSQWNFKSKIVNYLSSLMFGVYLIHDNVLIRPWLWTSIGPIQTASHAADSATHFFIYVIATGFLVFIVCTAIEAVRKLIVLVVGKICTFEKTTNNVIK